MKFKYWLPDEENEKKEYETDKNAIIVVGANGSGKSKLGAWIEQQSMDLVHRIGAQRNLNFNENISLRNYSQSEDLVFYGTVDPNFKIDKNYRWDWGRQLTTKMIDDFEAVLSAILALKNEENDAFVGEYKKGKNQITTTCLILQQQLLISYRLYGITYFLKGNFIYVIQNFMQYWGIKNILLIK